MVNPITRLLNNNTKQHWDGKGLRDGVPNLVCCSKPLTTTNDGI